MIFFGGGIASEFMVKATIWALLVSMAAPTVSSPQEANCDYDRQKVDLVQVRRFMGGLRWDCVIQSGNDFLATKPAAPNDSINTLIILGYAHSRLQAQGKGNYETEILAEYKSALTIYRALNGNLDSTMIGDLFVQLTNDKKVSSRELFNRARFEVLMTPIAVIEPDTTAAVAKPSAWYKKWWAIASGVGVVAVAAALAAGGGDGGGDDVVPIDTIPSFPPPPK